MGRGGGQRRRIPIPTAGGITTRTSRPPPSYPLRNFFPRRHGKTMRQQEEHPPPARRPTPSSPPQQTNTPCHTPPPPPPTVVNLMSLRFGACVSLVVADCCMPPPPFVLTVKVVAIRPRCHCCHPGRPSIVIASPNLLLILPPMSAVGFIAKPNWVYCARPSTASSSS